MNYRLPILIGMLIAILITGASCAQGVKESNPPTVPDIQSQVSVNETSHYVWAFYTVYVDPETNQIDMVPLRDVAGHWNVLRFLEKGPCLTCVKILGVVVNPDGTKDYDVQITHPFPNATFTGFDVRGIAMFQGSHTFPMSELTTSDRTAGDGELLNADGFTTLYNPTTAGDGPNGLQGYEKAKKGSKQTPNSLLNGYMRFISPGVSNTRNAFYANSSVVVTYKIDPPDGAFIFNYCIDASWVKPTVEPVKNPMTDFPPEANCPEPWKIEVTQTPVGDGLTDEGGQTVLTIDVYDHQGKSSIFAPVLECPELFSGDLNAVWKLDGSGYTSYEITVDNEKLAAQGIYKCLIGVEDTENATSPDWLDLTAYQVVSLEVGDAVVVENLPPTAAASADNYNPITGEDVQFTDESTDPDGASDIKNWEWDFSFDPVDGFQPGSFEQNPNIQYNTVGVYKVQLRVTDSVGHWDMLDTPLTITVGSGANLPPVAAAHASNYNPLPGEMIDFFDDSTDPDGAADITKWEWDFSFDPVDGFQPGSLDQNPSIQYPSGGTYWVQLRVTDTALNSDMLNTPLVIQVASSNEPPIACADFDLDHPMVSQIVHFYDCSDDPDGFSDIVQFAWDFDGDGTPDKFGQNTTKSWTVGGDYEVQHKVTDTASNFDWLDEPLLIEVNGPPVAAAEADKYSVKLGELVTITNLSTDDDGNGPIEDVYWDINGNGEFDDPEDIQNQDEIQLSFYAGGIHEIGLKVVDVYDLETILDPPLEITVEGFDPFCVNLSDQYNSADSLYGVRTFNYFQGAIGDLAVQYKDGDGPWDFTDCPPSQPAICEWLLPTDPEVDTPQGYWPDADFFFKEAAPITGGSIYAPHRFEFTSADNGILWLEGQWQKNQDPILYYDTFDIDHPICHPWADSGAGTANFFGFVDDDVTWTMTSLGTGPAIFIVDGEQVVLNCMLIRHNISFVDTEYGTLTFSLLNYQWIDEDGNEVAFMEAQNGAGGGTNFSGNSYTGEVICRSLTGIQ